jgi:serine/threonine-protein kinase RsbW
MLNKLELKIQGETSSLDKIRSFILDYASRTGFSSFDTTEIVMAVDELCTNIINYSYLPDPDILPEKREIEIAAEEIPGGIRISVSDHGKPFDPNRFPEVDIKEHIDSGKTHGLGIYAMKKYMDEVMHEYKEGRGNTIVLVKYVKNKSM